MDVVAARIPTWKAGMLTDAGRVLLTKVTLSAIPVHLSITCCLSPWAIKQIDKRRRAFLWAGADTISGGRCKVAWPVVYRPTGLGGLGVVDLRFFGFALRLRWEWLAREEPQRCWVSLPSKPEKTVQAICAASLSVIIGDGASTKLWTDSWVPSGPYTSLPPPCSRQYPRWDRLGCFATLSQTIVGQETSPGHPPLRCFATTSKSGICSAR